jgi:hypothetical protein
VDNNKLSFDRYRQTYTISGLDVKEPLPYFCKSCGKQFATISGVLNHINESHPEEIDRITLDTFGSKLNKKIKTADNRV